MTPEQITSYRVGALNSRKIDQDAIHALCEQVERLRGFLTEDDEDLEPRKDLLKRVRGAANDRDLYRRASILHKKERDQARAENKKLRAAKALLVEECAYKYKKWQEVQAAARDLLDQCPTDDDPRSQGILIREKAKALEELL